MASSPPEPQLLCSLKGFHNISRISNCFLPSSFHSTPLKDTPPAKTRLSRTLSDMPSSESDPSDPGSSQSPRKVSDSFSPVPAQSSADPLEPPLSNGKHEAEEEEALQESCYHSFHSNGGADSQILNEGDASGFEENSRLNGGGGETVFDFRGAESGKDGSLQVLGETSRGGCEAESGDPPLCSGAFEDPEESLLVPMTLYMHRVKGLVLALLVEPHFSTDTASMEEVVRNSCSVHLSNPPTLHPHASVMLTYALVSHSALPLWFVCSITAAWRHSMDWRPI